MTGRSYSMRQADTGLYGVRNILTAFDLQPNKPDVAMQLIKKFSDQFKHTVGLDLTLLGSEMGISSEIHTAFTEGRYWNTMEVDGDVAQPAINTAQAITISLDEGAFFPKKGMVVLYPGNTRIQGLITDVDLTTPASPIVTVVPSNGGQLPAVTDGTELVLTTSAWGEGTGQPDSTAPTFGRLDYYLQIIKDTYGITGSQLTNQLEFDVDEDGRRIGTYNVGIADMEARMLRMEEMMMLIGNGTAFNHANLVAAGLVDGTNNFVQTSRGLIEWANLWGGVDNTVDNTTWTVSDLDDIDDYLKSEGDVSPIVIGYVGGLIGRRMSSQLGALTPVTNSYDPTSALSQYLGGVGYDDAAVEARAVNLRFMEYKNTNRTYAFREVQSFSDTKGLGATGYDFNNYTMWFPLCNIKDGKTGEKMPLASLMYKQKDGYSRRSEVWEEKGAGGDTANYNSAVDSKKVYMRSHIGFAMHKPNLTYMTTPA